MTGSYTYDDFRLTFERRPGSDAVYTVHAVSHNNFRTGEFTLPMPTDELEQAVVDAANALSVRGRRSASTERDIGGPETVQRNAAQLGGVLADALFAGAIGEAYDVAWHELEGVPGRGLRLTLSLGRTPELLSLPWEFLFRRPTFLAVQPHMPLVRHLDIDGHIRPPRPIDNAVRILGVISNPIDLTQLNVESEMQRMNMAVEAMAKRGRVELDWLPQATPESLFEALRDGQYHVLHYVGHSDFAVNAEGSGEGVLFLEHADDRRAVKVDAIMIANLLGNQSELQLVVLNSCEGARTSLTDAFAGVATTLIHLGVPAVIAMQFEISDDAAIVFAEEFYGNLIGRQVSIDTAVADARRAIFVRGNEVEWATPVLFLRDPEIQLFTFTLAPVSPARPWWRRLAGGSTGWRVALAVVAVAGLVTAAALLWPDGASPGSSTSSSVAPTAQTVPASVGSTATTAASVDTAAPAPPVARLGTGTYAVVVEESNGSAHIYEVDAQSGQPGVPAIAPKGGVVDAQPVWDPGQDRLAYTRQPPGLEGTRAVYSHRDNPEETWRKEDPVIWSSGEYHHSPAWGPDGSLLYATTVGGCRPAPGCDSSLQRIRFAPAADGEGYLEAIVEGPTQIADGLVGAIALAAHPLDPGLVAVAGDAGIELLDNGRRAVAAGSAGAIALAFTPNGEWLAAVTSANDQGQLTVWPSNQTGPVGSKSLRSLLRDALDSGLPEESRRPVDDALRDGLPPVRSLAPGDGDNRLLALLGDESGPALLLEIWIDRGEPMILAVSALSDDVLALGVPAALAFSS